MLCNLEQQQFSLHDSLNTSFFHCFFSSTNHITFLQHLSHQETCSMVDLFIFFLFSTTTQLDSHCILSMTLVHRHVSSTSLSSYVKHALPSHLCWAAYALRVEERKEKTLLVDGIAAKLNHIR